MADVLRFDDLHLRHEIDEPQLTMCANAARVRLDCHHAPPALFNVVTEAGPACYAVEWLPADDKLRRSYMNVVDATCNGAYALALAVVEREEGLVAVARAETATGADWVLAPSTNSSNLEDSDVRLEVSGTDGDGAELRSRFSKKKAQLLRGSSDLRRAVAAVVGFKEKAVLIGWASK